MNTEQSTQPKGMKENQSVESTVQSTSAKLSVEQQLSPQPPTKQQLSLQPPANLELSLQPLIDRQPSPKLIAEHHSLPKLSAELQPSPVGQGYQQPFSMSLVDLDESDGDIDSCQYVLSEPVTDGRPFTKIPPSNFKLAPQPDTINERSTPMVRHEHSLPVLHSREVSAVQSREPNYCQKAHLDWILTAPKMVPRSSNTTNQLFQQYGHPQLPNFLVNSTLNSKFQPQAYGGKNSIVADNYQTLHPQDIIDSIPSTSHHERNSKKLSQMLKLKARQQSTAMKNPVDKKTRLEGITKNISTLQYSPNSMKQFSLPSGSTVTQPAQFSQHHLQQAHIDGSLMNNVRCGMREHFNGQRVPCPQGIMNTPAAQNLSNSAHQYRPFLGTSCEQQYLPTREGYLQQFIRIQDMLRRPTMTPTIDQNVYHQNALMNGGFIIQSQPNPINQPIQFLPQNGNQCVPNYSVHAQEVKRHELTMRSTDGAHITYEAIAPKEVNIQFAAHHSSKQSHQDYEHPQQKQNPLNNRDPRRRNTQNSLPLKSTRSSHIPKPQNVTKRSRSVSTSKTPSQALLDAQRSCLIQERQEAISENQMVELATYATQNAEIQTMPSSNQRTNQQETQLTLVQNKHDYQYPHMKKTMIDQAIETDSIMVVDRCVEALPGSPISKSASRVVESVCQTNEWLGNEQEVLYQETSSDSENVTEHELESENEVVPEEKTRLEGITKNISTLQYSPNSMKQFSLPSGSTVTQPAQFSQNHFQQAHIDGSLMNNVRCGMREHFNSQRVPCPQGIMNTPAAQNLSNSAHQYRPFLGTSCEQQYLPTREDNLQQFIRIQDMLRRPTMTPTIDQNVYHQNALMNGGFIIQSQPNPINQPIQFLPQNGNQCVPNYSVHAQEVKRHELTMRSTDGAHITYEAIAPKEVNIQFAAHHLSMQSHRDYEHPQQKQNPLNNRDPRTRNTQNSLPLKSTRSSHIPKPQNVTKRSRSVSTSKTPSQALLDAQRSCLIQERQEAISENQMVELATYATQNAEIQTMPSSNQRTNQQETQSTLVQNKHDYQYPHMKKTMVDQATETDSIMVVDRCVEAIPGSPISKSASRVVESVCQTDEWLGNEQEVLYQETSSDSENVTEHEIESENEVVPEANETTLTAEQNLTLEYEQVQSRICVETDTLDVFGTLVAQMGDNMASIRDMFHSLQMSTLVCAKTYEKLLEKVDKFNSIQPLQISTSPPNNAISQVTQERPAGDIDNTTSVGNAIISIREQRGAFSLPAEYDPNDTKWTLKYRENKPGLVELIPRTGVYVSRKELKRCIRESNDCRTLARLLLTEVFRKNALSVCSWTGGKAKAFNSVNIDVRPGLDEQARMILLTFVEEHGKKHGWIRFDTAAVMSTIRTKINAIRAKHGRTSKV